MLSEDKIVSVLSFLNEYHFMKAYWGSGRYSSTHSLASALDGVEWSASRPGRFTPRERAPSTHWIESWVGLRAGLDAVVKRKILNPRRESKPRTPIVQPVAQSYTDWAMRKFKQNDLWFVYSVSFLMTSFVTVN
jgi:hypothetical protein